jgi:hypothetical protein
MWQWIKDKWNAFHNWCAKITPGVKTFLVTALGLLGNGAAAMQEYITGIPLDKFATGLQIMIINMVLFTLAFWFRSLANRAPSA